MVLNQLHNLQNTQKGPRELHVSTRPTVAVDEIPTGFLVHLSTRNPGTGRVITKRFTLKFAAIKKDKLKLTPPVIQGIIQHLLASVPLEEIRERYDARGMVSLVSHFISKISRRKIYEELRKKFAQDGKMPRIYPRQNAPKNKRAPRRRKGKENVENEAEEEEEDEAEGEDGEIDVAGPGEPSTSTSATAADNGGGGPQNTAQKNFDSTVENTKRQLAQLAIPLPSKQSIFIPEHTGVTFGIIGKSFSGKTHFWVHELNKLNKEQLNAYNAILFFTESTSAEPLSMLKKNVKKKMITMDRFCPSLLAVLKRLNDETKNKFKFLVILDDILELRSMLIIKMVLTLRNSNISTVISIQYEKLLTPSQRSSLHNLYIFNLRTESWEYMLKGYLLGNFKELVPALSERENIGKKRLTPSSIAEILRESMNDYICGYDQRRDQLKIYYKRSGGGGGGSKKRKSAIEGDSESEDDGEPKPAPLVVVDQKKKRKKREK